MVGAPEGSTVIAALNQVELCVRHPSNQRRLRPIVPAAPDIQPAVLQFVLYSSLTKKAGIETIQKELKSQKVEFETSKKITWLKDKLKEDEKQRHEKFLRKKLEENGTDAGDQTVGEMLT